MSQTNRLPSAVALGATLLCLSFAALAQPAQTHVRPSPDRGAYGTGIFLARPIRGREWTGTIFKTHEMHITLGQFSDDNRYYGDTWDVSTKDDELIRRFNAADDSKHYLFSYWYSYPLHFNMQDTSYIVTGFSESPEPAAFAQTGLPMEFNVMRGRVGHYTSREGAYAKGRIVGVERWSTYILNRSICTLLLAQGSARRSTDDNSQHNEIAFNIYSEEGCRYVEAIVPYGLEVSINYSETYFSFPDGHSHVAHHIKVEKIPGLAPGVSDAAVAAAGSIAEEVLRDPVFQAGVLRLINEHMERARSGPGLSPQP